MNLQLILSNGQFRVATNTTNDYMAKAMMTRVSQLVATPKLILVLELTSPPPFSLASHKCNFPVSPLSLSVKSNRSNKGLSPKQNVFWMENQLSQVSCLRGELT